MARAWCSLLLSVMLIAGPLSVVTGLPEIDDDAYWYNLEDSGGDEHANCQFFVDGLPGVTEEDTPCDIVAFEIGNTESHLVVRWTLATLEFGSSGGAGFVDYRNGFRGDIEDDEPVEIEFRLYGSNSTLELVTAPSGWESAIEFGLEGNQITYSIPFSNLGSEMESGEIESFLSYVNVTRARTTADFTGLGFSFSQITEADDLGSRNGNETYVIQPAGDLLPPRVDPFESEEDVDGDTLSVSESFETSAPEINDECRPWNESCRQSPQPFSERHTYNWEMPFASLDVQFDVEAEQGSAELTVTDLDGVDVLSESIGEVGSGGEGSLDEQLGPVQPGDWVFTVELDRFEGSFSLTATEGPALEGEGGGGNGPGENGGGSGNDTGGNGGGNETDDLDEGGIPAPGVIVVVLAILGGILAVRRRR